MSDNLKKGDCVRVASQHRWMSERYGTIKEVENRVGNRYLVKFEAYELGMWHDQDNDPVLRLGDRDLILVEKCLGIAA